MKRRTIALMMAAAVAAGSMTGCGSSKTEQTNPETEQTTAKAEVKDTETETSGEGETEAKAEDGQWEYNEATLTASIGTDLAPAGYQAVFDLAEEKLGIHVEVEVRGGGDNGDAIIKTRLASGDMADLCGTTSGALLSALNPAEYFIDITNEDWADRLDDTYKQAVTIDGVVYGIPTSSAKGGVILYNKNVYEKYNLEVPKTWDEFLHNCDVLKEAGEVALIGSYADQWTTQFPFLGDYYNVMVKEPDFAEKFEKGEIKFATNEAGLRSWEKLADTTPYYNDDYMATTYNDACDMIVTGEGAHYFSSSQALSNIYELYGDEVNNVRAFAIPGDDPEEQGQTVWEPSSWYGNKNSGKVDDIKRLMEFMISDEALDVYTAALLPEGPYCVKGYKLPDNAYDAVKFDLQQYFDSGKTGLALEFITPVKGADCPAICQELGTGQTTPEEAAAAYDEDCKKQAAQLGLDW